MIKLKKNNYTIYISEKEDGTARDIKWFTYTNQVHGDNIAIFDEDQEFISSENDAIISKRIGVKIWVLLADCNGIVIMGKIRYGIVHAGWKWLKNGILSKTLHVLNELWEDTSNLQIYVWPSIRKCCYEVGDEFIGYFDKKYFDRRDWKLYFDMIAMIRDIAWNEWIWQKNIEINEYCTACSWRFFSYRRNNENKRITVAIKKNSI